MKKPTISHPAQEYNYEANNVFEKSSLFYAVEVGDFLEVKYLLRNDNKLELDESISSSLCCALEKGFKNIACLILDDRRFNPNYNYSEAFKLSISLGYLDVAKILLEKGANPNLSKPEGEYPIFLALDREYFDLFREMVKCGAEVNVRDKKGNTPLICASIKGHYRSVNLNQ